MIPAANVRTVASRGVMAGAEFGISLEDSAHIMTILRDTLYTDKIMAVLREYSANAWDSHRMVGKPEMPIKVIMPTYTDPTLTIQDFGVGLSRDDVFNIYTQYGASTKRDSNTAVGMLGIGSKSGFAYSDMFTVTSRFGGVKSVYSAMLDASDKGIISLIGEEPCGDETGIAIEIPVKTEDIGEFEAKACQLFRHFDPRPDINIDLPELPDLLGKFKNGTLYNKNMYDTGTIVAVMGCVPYRLNLNQVANFKEGMPQYMWQLNGALHFDIGEVHINASREELKYSDHTKRNVLDKLNKLVEEYIIESVKAIDDPNTSCWDRRIKAQALQAFNVLVPKHVRGFCDNYVKLEKHIPTIEVDSGLNDGKKRTIKLFHFTGKKKKDQVDSIYINSKARIIIKDTPKSVRGYNLGDHDIVVYPNREHLKSFTDLRTFLDCLFTITDLTGIPIVNISSLPWESNRRDTGDRVANPKHGQKFFVYNNSTCTSWRRKSRGESMAWDIVDHVPSKEDVYVEIEHFKCNIDLPRIYSSDKILFEKFGITMPPIYAYKIGKRNPSCARLGTHYEVWRKETAQNIMKNKTFIELLERDSWVKAVYEPYSYEYNQPSSKTVKHLKTLGEGHLVYEFFKTREYYKSLFASENASALINTMKGILTDADMKIDSEIPMEKVELIYKTYPILSIQGFNLVNLMLKSDDSEKLINYIKMVDSQKDGV